MQIQLEQHGQPQHAFKVLFEFGVVAVEGDQDDL